jgi:formylglycine-generating enzyme required for sulfatase activity
MAGGLRVRVLLFPIVACVVGSALMGSALGLVLKPGNHAKGGGMLPASAARPSDASHDRAAVPEDMVWIPGGTFWRGTNDESDTQPVREIAIDGFLMDRTEVTNAQFAAFVTATG